MKRVLAPAALLLAFSTLQARAGQEVRVFGHDDVGYLGVALAEITAQDAQDLQLKREAGARVEEVVPDSPAEKAGLQPGDVIVGFSGVPVLSARQMQRLVRESPAGRTVELEILRAGGRQTLSATLESPKEHAPRFQWRPEDQPRWRLGESFRFPPIEPDVYVYSGRPRLGVQGIGLTSQLAEFLGAPETKGVLITEVLPDSPAQKAGLKAGDAILKIDGAEVSSVAGLSARLKGPAHQLEVLRDKQRLTITAELENSGEKRAPGVRF